MATKKPIKKSVKKSNSGPVNQDRATASLVFGVFSMVTFFLWFLGIVFSIVGIVFGIAAIKAGQDKGRSIAGIATATTGLALSLAVALFVALVIPQHPESQRALDIQSDTQSLAWQLSNLVDKHQNQPVKISELSTNGFHVIKHIQSSGQPTSTTAIFDAGIGCSGAKGPNNYTITYLDEDNQESCTGFEQN
jgi:hypothetical protein